MVCHTGLFWFVVSAWCGEGCLSMHYLLIRARKNAIETIPIPNPKVI